MEPQVRNMMNVIHELNLESFVRDFDNKNGFMWTDDNRINKIGNLVLSDGHSGCSFACCLRNCQYYLNNPNEIPAEKKSDGNFNESDMISDDEMMFENENAS